MGVICHGEHFRELIGRLPEAAEYDFLEAGQISHGVHGGDDLFRGRIAVSEPEVISVIARALVSHAERTAVGAFVREVDIQVSVEGIDVGILAVFAVIFIPAPRVLIFISIVLRIFLSAVAVAFRRGIFSAATAVLRAAALVFFVAHFFVFSLKNSLSAFSRICLSSSSSFSSRKSARFASV